MYDVNEKKFLLKVINREKGIEKVIEDKIPYEKILKFYYLVEKIYKEIIIHGKEGLVFPNEQRAEFEVSIEGKKIKIKKNGEKFIKISKTELLNLKRRLEFILSKFEFEEIGALDENENENNEIQQPPQIVEKKEENEKKDTFSILKEIYNEIKNYENIKLTFPENIINNPKIFCKKLIPENWEEKMAPFDDNEIAEIFFIEKILNEKVLKELYTPILDFENNISKNYFVWKLIFLPVINSKNYIPKLKNIDKIVNQTFKIKRSGFTIFEKFWNLYQNLEMEKRIENSYLNVFSDDINILENIGAETEKLYEIALKELEELAPENTDELMAIYKEINEKIPTTVENILTKTIATFS